MTLIYYHALFGFFINFIFYKYNELKFINRDTLLVLWQEIIEEEFLLLSHPNYICIKEFCEFCD